MTVRNQKSWLEITDNNMFREDANPRSANAWKHLEALQSGGRLTASDILSVKGLMTEAARCERHLVEDNHSVVFLLKLLGVL